MKIAQKAKKVTSILVVLCLLIQVCQSVNTGEVCTAFTEQIGVDQYMDPNEIYQVRYWVEQFVDNRHAKISGLRHCVNDGERLFKGFQVTYSNGEMHEFGTMDDPERDATLCRPDFLLVNEEIL